MDFSLILFLFVLLTGLISAGYWMICERARRALRANEARAASGVVVGNANRAMARLTRPQPLLVEYARALFPVVLIVFLLRSFLVEPFRIPSGSMLPSLHIGDFILVNKFSYGLRLPLLNYKIIPLNAPQRGEVMVFRYPLNPKLNFIKRVIGLPGDVIGYRNKQLFINGQAVARVDDGAFSFPQLKLRGVAADQYRETIGASTHAILLDQNLAARDMEVTVPRGNYFVMGDNRDHSNDSRYWRFVPEDHLVGKAFFIWFSWNSAGGGGVQWHRLGTRIQ